MADALLLSLKRAAVDADGRPTKRLNIVADQLVQVAMEGDVTAIKEIFDRVDGRVPQTLPVDPQGRPARIVIGWLPIDVTEPDEPIVIEHKPREET